MNALNDLRMSEAKKLDAANSGQRGQDRSDALYDAFQLIRALPVPCTVESGEKSDGGVNQHARNPVGLPDSSGDLASAGEIAGVDIKDHHRQVGSDAPSDVKCVKCFDTGRVALNYEEDVPCLCMSGPSDTPAQDQAEPVAHWAVSVSENGTGILTIESNFLSGIPDIDKHHDTIKRCAEHLLSFIGEPYSTYSGCGFDAVGFMFWNEPDTQRHLTTMRESIGSHWRNIVPLYAHPQAVDAEAIRADERLKCAKLICSGCASGVGFYNAEFHRHNSYTFKCDAARLLAGGAR